MIKAANTTAAAPNDASQVKVSISKDLKWKTASTANAISISSSASKQSTVTSGDITVTAGKSGAIYDGKSLDFTTGATTSYTYDGTDAALTLEAGKNYSAADINKILTDMGADMTVSLMGH